jgi:methionyl-tRNA formyltransferase
LSLSDPRGLRLRVEGSGSIYEGVLAVCALYEFAVVDAAAAADVFVLANVQRIVRAPEFTAPRLGTLCFHPSLLPRHRGRDAVYWTVKMGDTATGVSWFWVSDKVDAGPIAAQRRIEIPPGVRPRDLYEDYLVPLGIESFEKLVLDLALGRVPRVEQDESLATYEPPRPRPVVER